MPGLIRRAVVPRFFAVALLWMLAACGRSSQGTVAGPSASNPSDSRGLGAPVNLAAPAVSGTLTVGSALTASDGSWSDGSTLARQWQRCDLSGAACAPIAGATASTYTLTAEDAAHQVTALVTATNAVGSTSQAAPAAGPVSFPPGTVCNASGARVSPPAKLEHVIVIILENEDGSSVTGSAAAPYFNAVRSQCGSSSGYVDNTFSHDLPSLPHYLALSSGSNCNTGLDVNGSGCITDDSGPGSHVLDTPSIFSQVASYRGYLEDMPSACDLGNPAPGTAYDVKHNPIPYYSALPDCTGHDVAIPAVSCPTSTNATCGAPSNAFTTDLANDTLAQFSYVIPNLTNDMHNGTISQGDNWLHTYLPLIFSSKAYLRGTTAVYVLWDEQGAFTNGPIPNLVASPYVQPVVSSALMNHFAALRAFENQLGISTYLGCAGGTPPGGVGTCPAGSTADLRAIFNF